MDRFFRALRRSALLLSLVVVFALVSVAPAFAGTGPFIASFHWQLYPSSAWTNGCRLSASADSGPSTPLFHPPFKNGVSTTWGGYTNAFNINNVRTRVDFGTSPYGFTVPPGATHPPGYIDHGWAKFNLNGPVRINARFRYLQTNTSYPYSPSIPVPGFLTLPGITYSSQPTLWNPDVTIDDETGESTPNTLDMVVTNVKFALSPHQFAEGEATLDNPEVVALFAASPDTMRPGPITVAPGTNYAFPPLPPGIGDPQPDGKTLLMKCEVADSEGNPRPFLMEFAVPLADPTPAPASSVPASSAWSVLALFAGGVALVLYRKRLAAS